MIYLDFLINEKEKGRCDIIKPRKIKETNGKWKRKRTTHFGKLKLDMGSNHNTYNQIKFIFVQVKSHKIITKLVCNSVQEYSIQQR